MAIEDDFSAAASLLGHLSGDDAFLASARDAADLLVSSLHDGGKVLVCGNGGSAADAQHFVAELVVRFENNRRRLPAVSLTTDSSVLTAAANDFGFVDVFSVQVEALARQGDIVVGISTSGESPDVIAAFEKAKSLGVRTLALLGCDGGEAASRADFAVVVPHRETKRIQEAHITLIHAWCGVIDRAFTE